MEVIEYANSRKVRVRFIDTGFEKEAQASKIKEGKVAGKTTTVRKTSNSPPMIVGAVYPSKRYGSMEIVEYVNYAEVLVRFKATGYTKYAEACNIRRGEIKDLLAPSVCGVGYVGEGRYNSSHKSNGVWSDMLRRCYNAEQQRAQPTYKGCSVVKEWHNFQTFAKWFDKHYIEDYELDKDIRVKGNKIYGPDTCMFVTQVENITEATAKSYTILFAGEEITVYNLKKFCRDNKLKYSRVYPVVASGDMLDVSKYVL